MTDDLLLTYPQLPPYVPDAPAPTTLAPWWRRAALTALDAVHPRTALGMLPMDADPYVLGRIR